MSLHKNVVENRYAVAIVSANGSRTIIHLKAESEAVCRTKAAAYCEELNGTIAEIVKENACTSFATASRKTEYNS